MSRDDLDKFKQLTQDLRDSLDLVDKENIQSIEENTRNGADNLKKMLANTERFIKNPVARKFWEDNFPTLLDIDLSLFRGALRQYIKDSLQEAFPKSDFKEIFENMVSVLDEDGSGTISIYEYNEFTLNATLVEQFDQFHSQILSLREQQRIEEELKERYRREEEERQRIEEEIRIRDEELRKLEEERLAREQEELKAREKEAQELELKRVTEQALLALEIEKKKIEEEEMERKRAEEEEVRKRLEMASLSPGPPIRQEEEMFEDLWENQRYRLGCWRSLLLPGERWKFSTLDGKPRDMLDFPTKHGYESIGKWHRDFKRECDEDGWEYGFGWTSDFKKTQSANSFVRRRRWIRKIQPMSTLPSPSLLNCEKDGFLVVLIVEARGVRPIDCRTNTSDVSVQLSLKNRENIKPKNTVTIEKIRNPIFGEIFAFEPKEPDTDILNIKLLHNKCELLGELELPVGYYLNRGPIDVWKQLQDREKKTGLLKNGKGWIHFQVIYRKNVQV